MTYKVSYVDFPKQYALQREEIIEAFDLTMAEGKYILGEAVQKFEKNFAKLCNTKYAISVANGTDALILSLKALGIGPGDEVITVSNSWISSASSIVIANGSNAISSAGTKLLHISNIRFCPSISTQMCSNKTQYFMRG